MAEAETTWPVTDPLNPKIPNFAKDGVVEKALAELCIAFVCDETLGTDKNDTGYDHLYSSLLSVALPYAPEDLSVPASTVKPAS